MKTPLAVSAALLVGGCAVTHKVDLPVPDAPANQASVTVSDDRLDPSLKIQTIAGTGGGFMLLESTPPIAKALEQRLLHSYSGQKPISVSIERLELLSKLAFMAADDMNCGLESSLKVGPSEQVLVRTRVRNTENRSPLVTTMARTLITACLEAHARDITAKATAHH